MTKKDGKLARKTIVQSVSFQIENWNYLQGQNVSLIVNEALQEHKKRRLTPELKIKLLKEKKREYIKKINEIDFEVKELEGKKNGK